MLSFILATIKLPLPIVWLLLSEKEQLLSCLIVVVPSPLSLWSGSAEKCRALGAQREAHRELQPSSFVLSDCILVCVCSGWHAIGLHEGISYHHSRARVFERPVIKRWHWDTFMSNNVVRHNDAYSHRMAIRLWFTTPGLLHPSELPSVWWDKRGLLGWGVGVGGCGVPSRLREKSCDSGVSSVSACIWSSELLRKLLVRRFYND